MQSQNFGFSWFSVSGQAVVTDISKMPHAISPELQVQENLFL
jgi:hypothetical protein